VGWQLCSSHHRTRNGTNTLYRLSFSFMFRSTQMARNNPLPALSIGMILFPNFTQLDLTGPYEVFARMPFTQVHLLAETPQPVRSERGLTILPDATWSTSPALDILFVPGGVGVNAMMEHPPLLDFLHQQSTTASYITAVCTGTLVLGAAGLL